MKEILIVIVAPIVVLAGLGYLIAGDFGAAIGGIIGLGIANLSCPGGGV